MINSFLLIIFNLFRFQLRRFISPSSFKIHFLQRISPGCSVKIFDNGRLSVSRNCEFASGCDFQVHGNGYLRIGDGTYFNRYCMISAHQHVVIGNHCIFGPGVKIFDNNHRFNHEVGVIAGLNTGEITIGDNCWIASDVVILKGVHVGEGSVIGAGCVVYKDIPAHSIVVNHQDLRISPIEQ